MNDSRVTRERIVGPECGGGGGHIQYTWSTLHLGHVKVILGHSVTLGSLRM